MMSRVAFSTAVAPLCMLIACSSPPPPADDVHADPEAAEPDRTEVVVDTPPPGQPPRDTEPDAQTAAVRRSDDGTAGPAGPGIRGRVIPSGTEHEPITTLQVEGRMALVLTGPLEPELRSLAGAVVVVHGPESGSPARRTIRVESYEVMDIEGQRPVVGDVLPGGRLAAGPDTLTLAAVPDGMRVGSRVWITGERRGAQLIVASWGVIRSGTE